MARKRKSTARQALFLAFAAGAVAGAASMLTLRRGRQDGGFPAGDVAGQLDDGFAPSLGGSIDASPQGPVSTPAAQHR
ncbi:hypothetical protein M8C17_13595 [Micromonospora sp. RHAY321]|uniref:hypothetical protein n=1 Tax=Micromonospora sp. RHAY321 TaxID=2944807 RepID=UPI00207CCD9A|nr:hypothetical protein [Micromonospora sp. RHAY321]MCO1596198.1 hypothetical protein [Micromonospora sp. RHAY321]